jgi:murein DD-endopeptidase MepM/ murein hydrolase activator NlpD
MEKINSSRWFNIISWGVTAMIVVGLLAFAYLRRQALPIVAAAPAVVQLTAAPQASSASLVKQISVLERPAILRKLTLKTIIPERPRYIVLNHTVQRGDSIFRISKTFNIKPETLLWANYEVLEDDPHSLKPGQELNIPPTDGLLYQWKDGDAIDKIAAKYEAVSEDIVNWPGNGLDLTNPKPKAGQWVMIPGGWRESKAIVLPTILRGSGTGTAGVSGGACGGGPSGGITVWPTANHFVSGNDYYPGHLAIDLAAGEGSPVYAAGSGVVTVAAGGWNGGYGNYIMIDHGGGYATLYAHLSVISVSVCQGVYAGQTIGAAGNTGNSFGAHLHFEVRAGGSNVNPWFVLP